MAEVDIKFERENLEGVVAVGTYLMDAAKRFGVHFEDTCVAGSDIHFCSMIIRSGAALLSPETRAETEHFRKNGRRHGERLACQVKIDKPGEVVVMTEEKVKEEPKAKASNGDRDEEYRKQFAEMPLDKKISNLVRLETMALGETVSFIINSPFKVADLLMGVMADFGFKKEEQQKDAARPDEHKADAGDPRPKPKKKTSKSKES